MRRLVLLLVLATSLAPAAAAQIALSLKAGSLGPGVELGYAVSPKLAVRAGASMLPFSVSKTMDDLEVSTRFDTENTLGAAGAFVDWTPTGSNLRLIGGAIYNLTKLEGTGTPVESWFLDQKEFLPEKLGSLTVSAAYENKVQPYVGIGYGNVFQGGRLQFLAELGAIYAGAPEIGITGTGMIAPTSNWSPVLTDGVSTFKWYPNLSLGLGFRL